MLPPEETWNPYANKQNFSNITWGTIPFLEVKTGHTQLTYQRLFEEEY
jgi:hypothetical protein